MLARHGRRLEGRSGLRRGRTLLIGGALAAWALVTGFVVFASIAMRPPQAARQPADGIVVLTGTELRLKEGARLLAAGLAGRMLVSGVNGKTRPEEIQRLTGLDPARFNCCVDLGYMAQSTIGNAEEARSWATEHGFKSLIVVTSSYHMPRSLAELELAMPGVRLVANTVVPKSRESPWWLSAGTVRTLLGEYVKFLPVAARALVARIGAPPRVRPDLMISRPALP